MRGIGHLFMDKAVEGIAGALVDPLAIQPFIVPGGDAASLAIKGETEEIIFYHLLFTEIGGLLPFE